MSDRMYFKAGGTVHLNAAFDDRTLCGDALEGDEDSGVPVAKDWPHGPVTCAYCITIIEHCRGVRTRKGAPHA
jgi:hypothetical protein